MRVPPTQFPVPGGKSVHTRQYNQFLGVDFSTDPAVIDGRRSPNATNLISDSGGYPEKRPGWEILQTPNPGPVNGLYHYVNTNGTRYFLAHCGASLYAWTDIILGDSTPIPGVLNDAPSTAFTHGGKLYLLDGKDYWVYNGTTLTDVASVAYVPTTVIGRAPSGGGVPLEAVNLLSPWRKNSFVGNGGAREVVRLQIYNPPTCTGSTNATLTLGSTTSPVTVTAALINTMTTVDVATAFKNAPHVGWTAVQIGDSVTFTKDTAGKVSPSNFAAGATGVLAGIVTLTPGAEAATTLQLDAIGLDAATVLVSAPPKVGITLPLVENTHFAVDRSTGIIDFAKQSLPTPYGGTPDGNGVDNIVVTFCKTVTGYADRIKKCTIAAWYGMGNDSRLFVSGNPAYQNWDWQSALYDPTYFPDTGYTKVGADSSAIMGYLRQYDSLLIIKEDNDQDATIFQRTAELDDDGNPYFPLKQGVAGIGAVSKYAFGNLRDDPLFLAKEGVFAPTLDYSGVKAQRAAQARSYLVNTRLTREENLNTAVAVTWNGLYLLCVNSHVYVADARKKTGKRDTEGYGYEWFYWTNVPARVFLERGGELFFGDALGRICRFKTDIDANSKFRDGSKRTAQGWITEDGDAIVATWSSKLDDDGDFMLYKTMPHNGSGVLVKPYCQSSIDVNVRTDVLAEYHVRDADLDMFDWGNLDFSHFAFDPHDAPFVIPLNAKIRNYKSIQIILRNGKKDEGFGCFGIVRRYTVNSYVK